jgi:signal transduction histidine kinase
MSFGPLIEALPWAAALVSADGRVSANVRWSRCEGAALVPIDELVARAKRSHDAVRATVTDPGVDRSWLVEAKAHGDAVVFVVAETTFLVRAQRRAVFGQLVHELRNVAFGWMTTLDALRDERLSQDGLECLATARQLAARLSSFASGIDQFLALEDSPARHPEQDDAGAPDALDRREVAVDLLVLAAVERCGHADGTFVLDLDPEPTVVCDPSALVRALAAILDDARLVSRTPPRVTATATSSIVTIAVADDGPALPHGEEHQIWEPLFRARKRGSGGLLSVARSLVVAQGGRVDGRNSAAGGAELSITLPRAR